MVALSKSGEIGDFQEANQFQTARSQFECGYFAVAIARSMAQVGQAPTLTIAQVIADAESWYAAAYGGNNSASNTNGMSLQQEYDLLVQVGLHFQSTSLDINVLKKWLEVGYPVLIAIAETSVYDLALNRNPYPWQASGNHIIVITGVSSDGNVLVRDSANCTNLNDPNSLRPGPRKYQADKLSLVSATVVVPPWMPRPASSTPPAPLPVQPPHIVSKWVSANQEHAALAEWISTAHFFNGGQAPPYTTGIALAWQARYRAGQFDGPPLSSEYDIFDWNGNPIIVQQFARRRYEWFKDRAEQY